MSLPFACCSYVNGNNQLILIAIQLKQKAGEDNPIFLPSDHLIDWLLSKIYYQSANLQVLLLMLTEVRRLQSTLSALRFLVLYYNTIALCIIMHCACPG